MLTNYIAANARTGKFSLSPFTRAYALVGTVVVVLFGATLLCIGSPAFAQQRVVVEKATGNVVDVGDSTLRYDTRYFDHMDFPASPIPTGENVRKYMRDASGAIVLRPKDELTKGFADEWRNDLTARVNNSNLPADLKAILLEIVKTMRR